MAMAKAWPDAPRIENAVMLVPTRDSRKIAGPSVRLERPIAAIAPATRALDGAPMPSVIDGFFLVPRLATHEDAGDES